MRNWRRAVSGSRGNVFARTITFLQPLRAFNRHFFTWQGYTGGWVGFSLSAAMAYFDWRTYRHLAALEKDPTTQVWQEFRELPAATCAVSVVIVSYNVADLLAKAISSVETDIKNAGISGEVIVVDNASLDCSVAMVRARFPKVSLIANSTNKGFGQAANQGMLAAQGESVVVLNPDASVQSGFFGAIQNFLARQPHVGLIGPHIAAPDGSNRANWHTQSTCRRSYTLATALLQSTPLEWWMEKRRTSSDFTAATSTNPKLREWIGWWAHASSCGGRSCRRSVGSIRASSCTSKRLIGVCGSRKLVGKLHISLMLTCGTTAAKAPNKT